MKRYRKNRDRIWHDSFVRELYFGGVLFAEVLQECRDLGSHIPLWLMPSQED